MSETRTRDKNREWLADASETQLLDLAFWLNAHDPQIVAVAIADNATESSDD